MARVELLYTVWTRGSVNHLPAQEVNAITPIYSVFLARVPNARFFILRIREDDPTTFHLAILALGGSGRARQAAGRGRLPYNAETDNPRLIEGISG